MEAFATGTLRVFLSKLNLCTSLKGGFIGVELI
jgi:hypothetical protein